MTGHLGNGWHHPDRDIPCLGDATRFLFICVYDGLLLSINRFIWLLFRFLSRALVFDLSAHVSSYDVRLWFATQADA